MGVCQLYHVVIESHILVKVDEHVVAAIAPLILIDNSFVSDGILNYKYKNGMVIKGPPETYY